MCQFSATADNQRDARQGEDLRVTKAPHGGSNWLTSVGKTNCAVCIPNTAVLAVQLPDQQTRGCNFQHTPGGDFLKFLDGKQERISLNKLALGSGVRVLTLHAVSDAKTPAIPTAVSTTQHTAAPYPGMPVEAEGELVTVDAGSGNSGGNRIGRRNRLTRFILGQ